MQLLGWITAAVFAPPRAALMQDLESGTLQEALNELCETYGVAGWVVPSLDLTHLQSSHTALFVSRPGGLPVVPYVAYAQDQELFGQTFYRYLQQLQLWGLEVSSDWRDLPDHVAAVGEAVALLAELNPSTATRLALDYLKPWFDFNAATLVLQDTSGFYGQVALVLQAVLQEVEHEHKAAQLP